jgi:hypothetical protein
MSKRRETFSSAKKRILAGILTAAIIVGAMALSLAPTFAGSNDAEQTFVCDNNYARIVLNDQIDVNSGVYSAQSNNPDIATCLITNAKITVSADKANTGIASIAFFTMLGQSAFANYQVYDPGAAAGYRIPGGKLTIDSVTDQPVPIVLDINIDIKDDGNISGKSLSTWNSDNPNNNVEWESLHKEVADIDAGGNITTHQKGSAVMLGTVIDKWGVKQSVPYLVVIGVSSRVVEAGDGTFWYPTDRPHIWIEADKDGNVLAPPSFVFDIDQDGPADQANPSIPVGAGSNGKYYEEDPAYPNIWHEIDPDTGDKTGKSFWGGPDHKPNGGDDQEAVYDAVNGEWWWADLTQNVFQSVSPVDGQLFGELLGGGPNRKPWETPARPIIKINAKYYVKASDGAFYYGDKTNGGNGLLMSTEDELHHTDEIFFYDPTTGSMIAQYTMKTQLEDLVNTAKGLDENNYTPESWSHADLPQVISEAEGVLANDAATWEDIKNIINDLLIGMGKLEEKNDSDFVIDPSYATVSNIGAHATTTFTAANKYTGDPVSVTWSIYTEDRIYKDDDDEIGTPVTLKSTIDPVTGVLHVSAGEEANVIIVVATSELDGSKAKAFAFVTEDPESIVAFADLSGTNADIGKTFLADGYVWLVLNRDLDGNLFITTTTLVDRIYYNTSNDERQIPYAASLLDVAMRNFYTNKLNLLKNYAKPAVFPIEPPTGSTSNTRNAAGGHSYVSNTGELTCFALSATEAFQSPGFIVNTSRPANASQNDKGRKATGFNNRYWLRTPYSDSRVCTIRSSGSPHGYTPRTTSRGVRPAMWINPQGN